MATRVPDARRNGIVSSVVTALDAGAGPGTIKIYVGAQPADADDAPPGALLATIPLSDPAFGAPAAGAASANAIAAVGASGTGNAGWFRAADSAGATVVDGSVTATGGGGDMTLNTIALVAGVDVDITTWSVTMPAG